MTAAEREFDDSAPSSGAGRLLNYRTTDAGHQHFEDEAARLSEVLGRKVTKSDVMREAAIRYFALPERQRMTLTPRKRKGKGK